MDKNIFGCAKAVCEYQEGKETAVFELNRLYNADCMEAMKEIPDKYFELAICDPPYGIGIDGQHRSISKNPKHNRKEHKKKSWDKSIPDENYFRELERISVNQIIWGGGITLLNIYTKGQRAGSYGTRGSMA